MFKTSKYMSAALDIALDITGKHYSDNGMMWKELSSKTGIPISTLERYDDWYILDDGFYYFKDKYTISELFISELARECNVRCVEFLIARKDDTLGIISKLYRDKNKQYYMYSDFCRKYFSHIPNYLGVFKLASSIALGEEKMLALMDDVFSLIGFDIFCGQWDREEYNLFFECDGNDVRVAPLCDNGVAFQKSLIYTSLFGKFNLEEEKISRGNLPFILSNELNFYNKLSLFLDIDVKDILDRTCEKYKIEVSQEDRESLLSYFDIRKKAVEHTLKLSRNNY